MIHMVLYLLTAYCIVTVAAVLVLRRVYVHKAAREIAFMVLFFLPLAPYGAVWLQTAIYGKAVLAPIKATMPQMNGQPDDIQEIRVLRVWPNSATVYVIVAGSDIDHPDRPGAGFVVRLVKSGDRWRCSGEWDVVWADGGSADGNVFPPYGYGK